VVYIHKFSNFIHLNPNLDMYEQDSYASALKVIKLLILLSGAKAFSKQEIIEK